MHMAADVMLYSVDIGLRAKEKLIHAWQDHSVQ